jgi:Mn2+/Fe2+ NRAMP family transporter
MDSSYAEQSELCPIQNHLVECSALHRTQWCTCVSRITWGFIRNMRIDTISGMFSSQAVSWAIIVVAATVLHGNGVTNIQTAADVARALLPLVHTFPNFGRVAQALFATGIIGLGLLAIPVLAGSAFYAVSESLQWVEGLDQKLTRAWGFDSVIIVATLVGLLLNFIGVNPINALVYAAVLNGVVAVPLLFVITPPRQEQDHHGIMGPYRSGWFSNLLVWLTFLGMGAAAVAMFATLGQ